MSNDLQNFQLALQEYMLAHATSLEDQAYIINNMKSNLKNILKQERKYGIIMWLILSIGFIFKRFGLKLTFLQSKIVALTIAAATVATSAAGIYYAGKYMVKKIVSPDPIENRLEKNQPGDNKKQIDVDSPEAIAPAPAIQKQYALPAEKEEHGMDKIREEDSFNSIIDTPDM